jgi:hypothetical protein
MGKRCVFGYGSMDPLRAGIIGDTDEKGDGIVMEYKKGKSRTARLKLNFSIPGVQAFAFTFG